MIWKEKYKKTIQKNSAFKISAPTWNEEFKLSDGSNFVIYQIFKIILNMKQQVKIFQ